MAFVSLIFTALSLKKVQKVLVEEKLEAIKADEDKTYKKKFKFRHIGVDIREGFKKFFKKLFRCSETSPGYKTCYKLSREGSCENYVLKSALGFVGGVFLTYFLYIFFVFQLNIILTSATVVCSILGCVLTVGLAFSSKIRCVVLLTLPQFFSKRGRQALMAYAFVLALTGPAQNTLTNMGILSESLACGQEQLKQAVKQIIDVIKKPFMAIKEAIKKVVKTVKEVIKKIKEILLKIKRIIMALVRVIKSVFEFLGKIINICNKELGTPFERCTRVFENAIADCNAKLGPLFNWLCSLTYIVKAVCYIVKVFDYVCMLVDFISNSVVGVVIRKIKIFVRHIKTMFYVRIKFSHSFKYQTITSKSMTEIAKEIVAEIKERSRGLVAFFNFMTSASMMFFMYLVFQVTYYRLKYLTSERFDNIYITKNFREIDQRRAKIGKETVLPLTKRERRTYVAINSAKLAHTEKRQLSKAAAALATASVKLGTHMIADYSLYWILTMISYHARYQSKVQAPNLPVAHITGEGFLATLLRSIVNAFQPVGIKLEIDTVPCLPIPIPPDFDRYVQIGVTVLLCWILTVLEPYGLRFRNFIMGYYHPVRAKQRTIWLYNHILRYRTSFLLLARRKLRKKFGLQGGRDEMSCKDLLRAKLNCAIFRICLGSDLQKTCLLCGEVFREKDKSRFVKCHTPRCPGLFCLECFADLKNICPICLSPLEYGDLDEINEEKDSSGDEPPSDKPKKKRRCPSWLPCGKPDDDDKEPSLDKDEVEEEEEKPAEQSDSSTDYSYSYQYDDDYKDEEPPPIIWKDVEMQAIPDEASMDSFREGDECLSVDLENKIRVPKGYNALVRMDVVAEIDEELLYDEKEEEDLIKEELHEETVETQPLLETCTCSLSRHVEFIGVPNTAADIHKYVRRKTPEDLLCNCSSSDLEDVEDDHLRSTTSTSTRSDCKYCTCPNVQIRPTLKAGSETEEELRNVVPKLDLSFLEKDDEACTCNINNNDNNSTNTVLSSRFSYVTYRAICETSSPFNRSLASSSVLSSLQNSPLADLEEAQPLLRKRNVNKNSPNVPKGPRHNVRTQYSTPEVDSPSSMDSYEFNKVQNRKVKQYYDATRQMCSDDKRCQIGRKKRSFTRMFQKLLPKRKRGQSYLPLHQRDIDDVVQVQSYNYNRDNWDTLSLDTNSPTYPFASQISTDSSDEEERLVRGKRIRGGECTHLIKCRLLGRQCPQRRGRSFDAKSRTKLKDFSTLSLPPKPKPINSKELFSRYFVDNNVPSPPRALEKSMKPTEASKAVEFKHGQNLTHRREDNSEYILPKDTVAALVRDLDAATPPSSDSGLSEATCAAIFGTPCPEGFRITTAHVPSEEILLETIEAREEVAPEGLTTLSEEEEKASVIKQESLDSKLSAKKSGSAESRKSKCSVEYLKDKDTALEDEKSLRSSESRKSKGSIEYLKETALEDDKSLRSESRRSKSSIEYLKEKDTDPNKIASLEDEKSLRSESQKSIIASRQLSKEKEIGSGELQPGAPQTISTKPLAKRKSTQLNQLLYKDERTEISLVQRLSPDKGTVKSVKPQLYSSEPTPLSPRPTPSVKLKISLHNSIIPEEDAEGSTEDIQEDHITMRTPRSQDKIVETRDSFPLQLLPPDPNRDGKLILSSDKTQQTSDNDIYRTFRAPEGSSSARERSSSLLQSSASAHTRPYISATSDPSSQSTHARPSRGGYYSDELPERDAFICKNDCRCTICKQKQLGATLPSEKCSCCRCSNAMGGHGMAPARPSAYHEFSPSVTPAASTSYPPTSAGYDVRVFPASSTDTESPRFLPPPPPLPPHHPPRVNARRVLPPTRQPPPYRRRCNEHCNCYQMPSPYPAHFGAGYSGDSSQPPGAYRRMADNYGYHQANYDDPGYDNYEYDSSTPQFPLTDLPYQNNEEYMELVEELQDTLHSRNRSRVKRAMQEFEDRSKQNKPLDKPIRNYDESSESEEPIMRKIDQLRIDRKICCAEDHCSCGQKREAKAYPKARRQNVATEVKPSHWTVDTGSGEWLKESTQKCRRAKTPHEEQADSDECTCNCEHRYQ